MRIKRVALASATVAVAVVSAGSAYGAGPGDPKPPGSKDTACIGTALPVVKGDLYVPSGATCSLSGNEISGGVTVYPGGTLHASGTSIKKSLVCAGATCRLVQSTVGHKVTVEGVGLLEAEASRLGELECNQARSDLSGCNVYSRSVIERRVTAGAGASVSVQQTTIGGDAKCDRCFSFDITDSTVLGSVSLERGFIGNICNNEIGGNLRISRGTGLFFPCAGSRVGGNLEVDSNEGVLAFFGYTVNGNLNVRGNSALIDLVGNTVRQNIICSRNVPPPLGAGNTAKRIDRDCGPIGLQTDV